jgi:hypothetical protein
MLSLYQWLKFIHILAGFTFIMGHGVAVAIAFRLKHEKDLVRVQAMFDLSGTMFLVYFLSMIVLFLVGIAITFMGGWWSSGWLWASLLLSLVITVWMFHLGERTYQPIRKAFGLPYREKNKEYDPVEPLPAEERAALIAATNPRLMLWVAYGGFVVVLWLMMMKPF